MNEVNTLNMSITQEVGWFALENEDMDPRLFSSLINEIHNVIMSIYKGRGPSRESEKETYTKKQTNENGEQTLKVSQEKVPHVIKCLVQHPLHEIEVDLTGINPQKEIVTRKISKPFVPSEVTELIPCYHNKHINQEQNNTAKR